MLGAHLMLFQIPISWENLATHNIINFEHTNVTKWVVWIVPILVQKPEMSVTISLRLERYETAFLLQYYQIRSEKLKYYLHTWQRLYPSNIPSGFIFIWAPSYKRSSNEDRDSYHHILANFPINF